MVKKTGQNAIKYSIITAFSKKGLDAAEKGLARLRKSFKKTSLANKLTFAAIGAGLTALAAKSIAAAKEQDKLNKKLEFSLKTLGQTTAIPSVNRFIDTLERQTGVASSTLIPAFMELARVTKDLTDAYDALNLALDISAITGDDVATIATAMAKGFAGNATALSKMIPGLDKATIKAADMQKIMKRLNDEFGGAAQGTMETYASKLAKFKVSLNKTLEIIGQGLLDFLQGFTRTGSIEDLGKAIERFGMKVADILRGLPVFIRTFFEELEKGLKENWIGKLLLSGLKSMGQAFERAADAAARTGYYIREMRAGGFGPRLWEIKNTKTWSDTVTKTVTAVKKANFKSALGDMFDLNKIALAAAKRNGILNKEAQTRIEALQALNTEQESDDELYYKKLLGLSAEATAKLIADQNAVAANLKAQLATQLADWQSSYEAMLAKAKYVSAEVYGTQVSAPRAVLENLGVPPTGLTPVAPLPPPPAVPSASSAFGNLPAGMQYGTYGATGDINVNVSAGVIADEDKLKYIIANEVVKYVRFGGTLAPAGFI